MSAIPFPPLHNMPEYLYAWMGMDEFGSGEVGIKQGQSPAGYIPLVSKDREKVERLKPQMQAQAKRYGMKIYLVRYRVDEIVDVTQEGE